MMLKKLVAAMIAVYCLTACADEQREISSETPKASSIPSAESTEQSAVSAAESSEAPPEDLFQPGEILPLDYENMMPAEVHSTTIFPSARYIPGERQFYTVQKDGLWGLIGEDGALLLPCLAKKPVTRCGMNEWSWFDVGPQSSYNEEALNEAIMAYSGKRLCFGHCDSYGYYFIDMASSEQQPQYFFMASGGNWGIVPLEPEELQEMTLAPVFFTTVIEDPDMGLIPSPEGYWNYTDGAGKVLAPGMEFDLAGVFGGEALAPVKKDGKWAYLNTDGELATGFVYDDCWFEDVTFDLESGRNITHFPVYAYNFWDGYAPVYREGKWGVLDSAGAEIVPCQYEGTAPYPGGAWLKENGIWTIKIM